MAAGFISIYIYKYIIQVSKMAVTKLMALASVPLLYNMTIEKHKIINIKSHILLLYQTTIHCHV